MGVNQKLESNVIFNVHDYIELADKGPTVYLDTNGDVVEGSQEAVSLTNSKLVIDF